MIFELNIRVVLVTINYERIIVPQLARLKRYDGLLLQYIDLPKMIPYTDTIRKRTTIISSISSKEK